MTHELPIAMMPGHLIRRLNQLSTAVFQARMKAAGYDITSVQFAALIALKSNPGIDQATLAGIIAYDRATIGGVVKRLLQKDLVTRKVDDEDRRARRLWLSTHGEAELRNISPIVEDLQASILSNLSTTEGQTLLKLLAKAVGGRPTGKAI